MSVLNNHQKRCLKKIRDIWPEFEAVEDESLYGTLQNTFLMQRVKFTIACDDFRDAMVSISNELIKKFNGIFNP